MKGRYRELAAALCLLLVVFLLCGCSQEKVEDNGELIWRHPEQIEMYI